MRLRSLPATLPRNLLLLTVGVALVAGGCTSSDAMERAEARAAARAAASTSSTSSTTSTTSSTTSTTAPEPSTTTPPPPPPPPPGLGRGATGPEVQSLEEKLGALKYDPGKVDGVFDAATGHAVMAFQKVAGLARTSRATDDVIAALAGAGEPPPLLPDGGPQRVEIDLKRQVLFVYQGGALLRVLPVATGNNKRYCVDGQCAKAVTPGGSFKVTRKIRGLRVSRLGKLYNPLYFNGGIAIHGSPSVPGSPASHGCVRIPMHTSLWFFDTVPSGTPVYVVGGAKAPVPFNEQAPPEDGSSTTSTTDPSSTSTTETTTTAPAPAPAPTPTTESTTTTAPTTTSTAQPPIVG